MRELTTRADETIKKELEGVNGVGQVTLVGAEKRAIAVELDPERMAAAAITVDQVMNQQWTQISDEACILSELCIARIDPAEPPEECQGAGQCAK